MRFYNHSLFPGFRRSVLIAEHGSWNRNPPTGYRVTAVKFDESGTPLEYSPFVFGWLSDPPRNCSKENPDCGPTARCLIEDDVPYCSGWGRPADIEVLPDGTILISDEAKGTIYRVTYMEQNNDNLELIEKIILILIISILGLLVLVSLVVCIIQRRKRYITIE